MFDGLPFPLAALLLLGSLLGHTYLMVFAVNWVSGIRISRRMLGLWRRAFFTLIGVGPLLFWVAFGFDHLTGWPVPVGAAWRAALAWYGVACCPLGLVVVPAVTVWNLFPRRPAALLDNHTTIINVAAELGYRPYGRGKHSYMARFPLNEIFQVDFAERSLRLPRLPAAWDGLTVLHLSDLHLCGSPDKVFFQHVMDRCRAWEPDLVAVTGDVIDDEHHRWVVPILGRLRWRVAAFAILGNHDCWAEPDLVRRRLRRVGMHVLGNSWEQIEVRGEPLVAIGHEGPWFLPPPDLSSCPAEVFKLCLSHTPDNIRWGQRHGVDLMLSGHNHGGQIRLPVIGSVFVPSRYGRRFDHGIFDRPPTVLHVSRGLSGVQPIRYNCRPEVTKIILKAP